MDMSRLPGIIKTGWRSKISSTPRPPTLDAVFERNGASLIGLACVSVKVASSLACHGLFNIFSFGLSMWLWVTNKVLPHEINPGSRGTILGAYLAVVGVQQMGEGKVL